MRCFSSAFTLTFWPKSDLGLTQDSVCDFAVCLSTSFMCSSGEVRKPKLQLMSFWPFTVKLRSLTSADNLMTFTVSELHWMHVSSCVFYRVNELYVDDPDKDSGGKIEVSLNISLPNLHCDCEYIHKIHKYSSEWCFSVLMCITWSAVDMLWVLFGELAASLLLVWDHNSLT